MIRTLIAEDEKPLLRGIAKMIELIDPIFTVVYTARNGKEAIDYLSQHDVDLVFTDINMPVLDGLAVLRFLSENKPDVQAVVISGYNEFEYARSAMRYGAKNYLLKPIDKNELSNLLSTLKNLLAQRSYLQKREALILQLFADKDIADACTWGEIQVAYLCAGAYQHSATMQEMREPGFLTNDVLLTTLRHTVQADANLWLFWGQYPNEAVLVLENAADYDFNALRTILQQSLKDDFITIAVSVPHVCCDKLSQEVLSLRGKIYSGLVFAYSKVMRENTPLPFALSTEEMARVRYLAQKKNADAFNLMMQNLKQHFMECLPTQHDLEIAVTEILSILQKEIACEDWHSAHQTAQELVAGATDYDTLFHDFTLLCSDVFANRVFEANDKDALMRTIDTYIKQHLSEPLSTKELSAHFGLVAPYLSKLFKQFKNISPSQYIQYLRIERAKNMLQNCPEMLAKDIAETLGYTSALYFSKTFKKNVGIYPSEYKAKYTQNKENGGNDTSNVSDGCGL